MISDDALYLITGCDKSKSWGVAAFSDGSRTTELTLKLLPPGIGGAAGSLTYTWQKPNSVAARSGPEYDPPNANQCVFLRGFRISIRQRLFGKQKVKISTLERSRPDVAFFGDETKCSTLSTPASYPTPFDPQYSPSSSSSSSGDSVYVEDFPDFPEVAWSSIAFNLLNIDASQPYHPLNAINNFILDKVGNKMT